MVGVVDVVVLGKYNVVFALLINPVTRGNFPVPEKCVRFFQVFPKLNQLGLMAIGGFQMCPVFVVKLTGENINGDFGFGALIVLRKDGDPVNFVN
jgi:hypothetical protein